jgi:hypothetical protein
MPENQRRLPTNTFLVKHQSNCFSGYLIGSPGPERLRITSVATREFCVSTYFITSTRVNAYSP